MAAKGGASLSLFPSLSFNFISYTSALRSIACTLSDHLSVSPTIHPKMFAFSSVLTESRRLYS